MDERTIFERALDLSDPQERAEFLDQVCQQNAPLRSRVEALLYSHEEAGSFLQGGADLLPATLIQPLAEQPGTQIGLYKLLQQIGEGGMGVVYMAEQTEPVERRVALKIIKPGMDTQQVIARFEAERQALAMMDHPHIAKVLDAGTTDSGRPYFVMELVKGVPITEYCDQQHLTPRERLELFVPICQAVQHAHQKGIIHRDLKPSNILVAQYDDKPVPKVIDFGVAKAISQKLTEKTMFTQYGQIVGTLEYMSPEQARFNQLDVDTRSDIYSLGVLLYELLTGETPFDKQRLRSAAFDEMLRIIHEEEPLRPSIRLSGSQTLPTIAANRQMEPKKLSVLVRGELDWIVMKALEKDRGRRYETASKFAEDVQHYLNDEAVVACPPSAGYRIRKAFRRHRTALLTVTVVVVSLLGGIVASTWQAVRARDAERLAEERLDQVNDHLTREQHSRREADLERKRAEGNLLLSIKALDEVYLRQVAKQRVLGDMPSGRSSSLNPTERQLLKAGLAFYDQLAQDNRDDDAALFASGTAQTRVGILQASLNQRNAAIRSFREAITRLERLTDRTGGDPDYFTELGLAYVHFCENSPWLPNQRETLLKAETAFGRAIALDGEQARTYQERAGVRRLLAKYEGALADFETALRLNPKDAALQGTLAWFLLVNVQDPELRDPQRALRHAREAVNLDPHNAGYLVILGRCLYSTGESRQALEKLTQAIQIAPRSTEAYQQRGLVHKTAGNLEQALGDANQLLEIEPTARGYRLRGEVLAALGRDQEALADFAKAEKSNPNDPYVYFARGGLYLRRKEYEKAVADLDRGLTLVPSHSWTYKRRIVALFHLGRFEDALRDVRTSIKINPKDLGGLICIGAETIASCPNEDFKRDLLEIAGEIIATPGMDHVQVHRYRADLLRAMGRLEEAATDYSEAIILDSDNWWLYHERGYCYLLLREYQKVVDDYSKALELKPKNWENWERRGRAYLALGKSNQAIADFTKLVELDPENSRFWNLRGHTYFELGNYEQALFDYTRLTELEPKKANFWNLRAIISTRLGDSDQAIGDYTRALNLEPVNPVLHFNRGSAYADLENWPEAAANFEESIKLGLKGHTPYYYLALVRLAAGDLDAYRNSCTALLDQFGKSDEPSSRHCTTWICALAPEAVTNFSRVLALGERGVSEKPVDSDAQITLGALLYRSGRFQDAVEALHKADRLVSEPKTASVLSPLYGWYFLAMSYQRLGNREEAKTWLDKANHGTSCLLKQEEIESGVPIPWNRRFIVKLLQQESEKVLSRSPQPAIAEKSQRDSKPPDHETILD